VSDRIDRLQLAFAALDDGDLSGFRELFDEEARWLGVPGSGPGGETPI
jgi:ketosteroid isomerase-like protein